MTTTRQVIMGSTASTLMDTANTSYYMLMGPRDTIELTEANCNQIISAPGTLSNFRFGISSASGAGKSWIATVRLNAASPANGLTVTVSGASDVSGVDTTHSITVAAGDRICVEINPESTPTAAVGYWACDFVPTTAGETNCLGGSYGNVSTAEQYLKVMGQSWSGGSAQPAYFPTSGTIKNFYVRLTVAPGAGTSWNFRFQKNGTNQSTQVTIANTDVTGSDTANTFTVAAGDYLYMTANDTGAVAATQAKWGFTFVPDTAGEFLTTAWYGRQSNANTHYISLNGASVTTTNVDAAEGVVNSIANAFTIKKLSVKLSAAPGAGKNRVYTVRKNASDTLSTLTIADTATYNTVTQDVSIAAGDLINLKTVPSGTPASSYCNDIVLLGYNEPDEDSSSSSSSTSSSSSIWDNQSSSSSSEGRWKLEKGTITGVPNSPTMKMSRNGDMHIATYDASYDIQYHKRTKAGVWSSTMIDNTAGNLISPSIALNSSGYPAVAYWIQNASTGRYNYWNGAAWTGENMSVFDGYEWASPQLGFDSSDVAHVTGICRTTARNYNHIAHWYRTGGVWGGIEIDNTNPCATQSIYSGSRAMVADGLGNMHSTWTNTTNTKLIYGVYNGTSWTTSELATTVGTLLNASVVVDKNSGVHVAYNDRTSAGVTEYVKYFYKPAGGSWSSVETIKSSASLTYSGSMIIDDENRIHLSYLDTKASAANTELHYATKLVGGASWTDETCFTSAYITSGTISYNMIDVGVNNEPYILFKNDNDLYVTYLFGEQYESSSQSSESVSSSSSIWDNQSSSSTSSSESDNNSSSSSSSSPSSQSESSSSESLSSQSLSSDSTSSSQSSVEYSSSSSSKSESSSSSFDFIHTGYTLLNINRTVKYWTKLYTRGG